MTEPRTTELKSTPWWTKALLIIGGTVAALVVATLILKLFPGLIGGDTAHRKEAGSSVQFTFRPSDGDLFPALPGRIRPPANNEPLQSFTIAWDADGFRVPAKTADHYPIAAFGDSFTEGYNSPLPWPDKLAELLNVPVRNYGYRGYGPLEEKRVVQEFAPKEARSWMLLEFFAGNDLGDIQKSTLIQERSPLDILPKLAQDSADNMATQAAANAGAHYDFPMPVIIGGNYYEMAFLTYYIWRQLAPPEGFAASRTVKLFGDTLDAMGTAVPQQTCKALIFVPSKEQLYYPYIHPASRQWLRGSAYLPFLDKNGLLQIQPSPITPEQEQTILKHLTDQRDAIAALVASKPGWHFVDLLPVFQKHVDAGELLYYPYDSHWTQDGHNLAAQTIAEAMRNTPNCPLN
jgi:hypothetical protein